MLLGRRKNFERGDGKRERGVARKSRARGLARRLAPTTSSPALALAPVLRQSNVEIVMLPSRFASPPRQRSACSLLSRSAPSLADSDLDLHHATNGKRTQDYFAWADAVCTTGRDLERLRLVLFGLDVWSSSPRAQMELRALLARSSLPLHSNCSCSFDFRQRPTTMTDSVWLGEELLRWRSTSGQRSVRHALPSTFHSPAPSSLTENFDLNSGRQHRASRSKSALHGSRRHEVSSGPGHPRPPTLQLAPAQPGGLPLPIRPRFQP